MMDEFPAEFDGLNLTWDSFKEYVNNFIIIWKGDRSIFYSYLATDLLPSISDFHIEKESHESRINTYLQGFVKLVEDWSIPQVTQKRACLLVTACIIYSSCSASESSKPVKSSTKVNPPGHALAIVRNSEKVPPIAGISIEQFGLLIEKIGGGRIHRALLPAENLEF